MRGEGEDARPSSCCPPQGPGHVLPSLEASLALSELSQPLKVCVPRCHSSYTPPTSVQITITATSLMLCRLHTSYPPPRKSPPL